MTANQEPEDQKEFLLAEATLREFFKPTEQLLNKLNELAIAEILKPIIPTSTLNPSIIPTRKVDLTRKGQSDHTAFATWEIKDEAIAVPIEITHGFGPDSKEWGEMRDRANQLLSGTILAQAHTLSGAFNQATKTTKELAQMTENITKVQEPTEAHYDMAREVLADSQNPAKNETDPSTQFAKDLDAWFGEERVEKGNLDSPEEGTLSWNNEADNIEVLFYLESRSYRICLSVEGVGYYGSAPTLAAATGEAVYSLEKSVLKKP